MRWERELLSSPLPLPATIVVVFFLSFFLSSSFTCFWDQARGACHIRTCESPHHQPSASRWAAHRAGIWRSSRCWRWCRGTDEWTGSPPYIYAYKKDNSKKRRQKKERKKQEKSEKRKMLTARQERERRERGRTGDKKALGRRRRGLFLAFLIKRFLPAPVRLVWWIGRESAHWCLFCGRMDNKHTKHTKQKTR